MYHLPWKYLRVIVPVICALLYIWIGIQMQYNGISWKISVTRTLNFSEQLLNNGSNVSYVAGSLTFSRIRYESENFSERLSTPTSSKGPGRSRRNEFSLSKKNASIDEMRSKTNTSKHSSKHSADKSVLPTRKTAAEEIRVKGNTSADWCYGLKSLYPPVINMSEIGGELDNISHFHKVVNPYSVNLSINPKHICLSSKDIYLISVVKSSVNNVKLRKAIRATWGKEAHSASFRLVFSLGITFDTKLQNNVKRESETFNDILQGDFKDTYHNNTLKTMMGLHWVATFCSFVRFVFFVDDDVMVNFKNLLSFYKTVSTSDEKLLFSGNLKSHDKPVRSSSYKWYMSKTIYPYSCYPPYISGAATITSGHVVRMLNTTIPYVRRFKYDDVFIGIVAQKLGIRPQKNRGVAITRRNAKQMKSLIASHGFKNPSEYVKLYNSTML